MNQLLDKTSIVPSDPTLAFVTYLIEDWADEWWWQTSLMHLQMAAINEVSLNSCGTDRLGVSELLGSIPVPHFLKKRFLTRRQRNGYTVGDGCFQKKKY